MKPLRYYFEKIFKPLPKPRDPTEIPSSEETHQALNYMRLALSYYEDVSNQDLIVNAEAKLAQAARAIAQARALDPGVTIERQTKGGTYTETLDTLAASCFYYESLIYFHDAYSAENELLDFKRNPDFKLGVKGIAKKERAFERRRNKDIDNSIRPAEMAVEYEPDNITYRVHLVRVYRRARMKSKAVKALQNAQRLAPDNIDVLKLLDS